VIDLSDAQRHGLSELIASGRLREVPIDPQRAATFIAHARDGLDAAAHIASPHVAFDVAYNAAHDAGEALMAALGVRPGRGDGAHATVGSVMVVVASGTRFQGAAGAFDALRQTRNRVRYDAGYVGIAQATHARDVASELVSFVCLAIDSSEGGHA
jgi:hypothetical protein